MMPSTLYDRLSAYSFDDIDAALPFTQRLAKEQGWTLVYAGRVIEEYKRFMFLAISSGHPVSPSEAVDQVWHLHLTYTQHYWHDFCPNLLGRPFHHNPTGSGPDEAKKHQQWYQNTLDSYQTLFQQQPPLDIWSPTHQRFGSDLHKKYRFDPQTHWLLPRPQHLWASFKAGVFRQRSLKALGLGAIALAFTGCSAINPLDLGGGEFLLFYIVISIAGLWVAGIAKSRATQAPKPLTLKLDAYDMAYLAGGVVRVNTVAVTSLVEQGYLRIDEQVICQAETIAPSCHPVEKSLWEKAQSSLRVDQAKALYLSEVTQIRDRLEQEGLLGSCITSPPLDWLARILGLAILALGVMKIAVGISRGKPVFFLVILVIIVALFALLFWITSARSRHGESVLKSLLSQHKLTPTLAISVALFGVTILASSADPVLASLAVTFMPPSSSSGGGDSGGDGGCGGGCGGCGGCGG